jgi:hypothetical protein
MDSTERNEFAGPSYQTNLVFKHRSRKCAEVENFFSAKLGRRFPSCGLHVQFGTGVRSRISEINSDPASQITIHNETFYDSEAGQEVSGYRAELRHRHLDLG